MHYVHSNEWFCEGKKKKLLKENLMKNVKLIRKCPTYIHTPLRVFATRWKFSQCAQTKYPVCAIYRATLTFNCIRKACFAKPLFTFLSKYDDNSQRRPAVKASSSRRRKGKRGRTEGTGNGWNM